MSRRRKAWWNKPRTWTRSSEQAISPPVAEALSAALDVLRAIDRPTVLVPGNAESDEELRRACRAWSSACVLHGSGTTIDGIPFFGLGGAVPVTPFGSWSFDLTEDQARHMLRECPPRAVLVTHAPPHGVVDTSARGASLGSVAIRETIEQTQPLLVVCGHIHDSAGQSGQIRQTPVVNVGPRGTAWEL